MLHKGDLIIKSRHVGPTLRGSLSPSVWFLPYVWLLYYFLAFSLFPLKVDVALAFIWLCTALSVYEKLSVGVALVLYLTV